MNNFRSINSLCLSRRKSEERNFQLLFAKVQGGVASIKSTPYLPSLNRKSELPGWFAKNRASFTVDNFEDLIIMITFEILHHH